MVAICCPSGLRKMEVTPKHATISERDGCPFNLVQVFFTYLEIVSAFPGGYFTVKQHIFFCKMWDFSLCNCFQVHFDPLMKFVLDWFVIDSFSSQIAITHDYGKHQPQRANWMADHSRLDKLAAVCFLEVAGIRLHVVNHHGSDPASLPSLRRDLPEDSDCEHQSLQKLCQTFEIYDTSCNCAIVYVTGKFTLTNPGKAVWIFKVEVCTEDS